MAKKNVVVAPLATVTLSDGSVHYLNRGAIVPDGVSKKNIEHLIAVGVVSNEEVLEVVDTTEGTKDAAQVNQTDVVIPEGDPSLDWKGDALKAYAAREKIDLGSAKTKPEFLDAIAAHREANAPAAPADSQES